MNKKWRRSLHISFELMDDWRPKFHWDYGGWDKNGRHNVLLTSWFGCKLLINVSIHRVFL